jgi:hypothetical protein
MPVVVAHLAQERQQIVDGRAAGGRHRDGVRRLGCIGEPRRQQPAGPSVERDGLADLVDPADGEEAGRASIVRSSALTRAKPGRD